MTVIEVGACGGEERERESDSSAKHVPRRQQVTCHTHSMGEVVESPLALRTPRVADRVANMGHDVPQPHNYPKENLGLSNGDVQRAPSPTCGTLVA